MAYRIVGIDDAFGVSEIGLGADFSFNHPAVFRTVYTTDQIQTARLKTLLLTKKGERVLQPLYGSDLLNFLFEPNINELIEDLTESLEGDINYWIPDLTIEKIDVLTNQNTPTLIHELQITINYSTDELSPLAITISLTESGNVQVESIDQGTQGNIIS